MVAVSLLRRNWLELRSRSKEVGWMSAIRLRWSSFRNKYFTRLGLSESWPTLRVYIPGYPTAIYMRTGTSDYTVLRQVFIDREYEVGGMADPRIILDCGANVGYTSIYFLTRYPAARVIAVEPDPKNAALCRSNLKPFGDRATLIESGVWSRSCRLALVPKDRCDEWGIQVREARNGEDGDLDSVDVPYLIGIANTERIALLKMDVEWSELDLFKPGASSWLDKIDNIAIELHDAECERVFLSAMEPYSYDLSHSGELTVCANIRPRSLLPRAVSDPATTTSPTFSSTSTLLKIQETQ
jgi:FkbM family methyltransferase